MMNHEEILALYDRRRAASSALGDELVRRNSRGAMEDTARRLGILKRGTMVFDTESEVAVFGDMSVFEQWKDGENAVRRMLRTDPPPEGTVEREVLEAKRDARYSIFAGVRTEPGVGVWMKDVFRPGEEVLVVDRGLALSDPRLAMATRLMRFPEFAMTTGAGIPIVDGEAMEEVIALLTRRYEALTLDEVNALPPPQRSEFAFIVARALLARGQARHIVYSDRPDLEDPRELMPETYEPRLMPQEPVRAEPRVGRNEPCPCGSGKKFKKCHGAAGAGAG